MDRREFEELSNGLCAGSELAKAGEPAAAAILVATAALCRVLFDIVLELRELNERGTD